MKLKLLIFPLIILTFLPQRKPIPEGYYPLSAVVTETDFTTDTVTITCHNGNAFTFTGVEDWCVGDICACIMHDNGTPLVYDDIIVDMRYCGVYR